MNVHVLTLFPDAFSSFLSHSMMKRAIEKGLVSIQIHDLRQWTHDRHRTCDDRPFGGGPGMLMKPEPIFEAVDALFGGGRGHKSKSRHRFIYMTPQGRTLDQQTAREFARFPEIVILCGHYEGVDQRVLDRLVTDEISIGDYVLTGGELPAMVLMDTVIRQVRGVLGCEASKEFESFSANLLEYPQYTRPAEYRGMKVPPVLLSGDHQKIEAWRTGEARRKTLERRPDLLKKDIGVRKEVRKAKVRRTGRSGSKVAQRARAKKRVII